MNIFEDKKSIEIHRINKNSENGLYDEYFQVSRVAKSRFYSRNIFRENVFLLLSKDAQRRLTRHTSCAAFGGSGFGIWLFLRNPIYTYADFTGKVGWWLLNQIFQGFGFSARVAAVYRRFICSHRAGLRLEKLLCMPKR